MSSVYQFLIICALLITNLCAWFWAFPERALTVSFLDAGQGDSILIESPTGVQVLVDGGPDAAVLRELGNKMPFFDRSLDAIIETHPDKDHIAGLVDVFGRYNVGVFVEPGIPNDTSFSNALIAAVRAEPGVRNILARRGMRLLLGGGAYADILFPDRDVSGVETNTGSVVMRVVYGSTSFLLTGDSPQAIEKYLVSLDTGALTSTVLKPGHHGSRTSSSPEYIAAVKPSYAVFSRGCDNSYRHPHKEVVELLTSAGILILDTCKDGTITFFSNGETLRVSER